VEKILIRDMTEILYNSPDSMTDGEVLDTLADYLKEKAVELGVTIEDLAAGR